MTRSFRWAAGAVLMLLVSTVTGWAESLTFICVSDTHWSAEDAKNERKRTILKSMNDVQGRQFPPALNEVRIGKPRGVLVAGDLINGGRDGQAQWDLWTRDFGLNGTDGAVVKLPVYETWGNHDVGKIVSGGIIRRNPKRVGPTVVSPENNGEGLNYSWDWEGVHFVTVGFYPGNANESRTHPSKGYDPQRSLDFLIQDLQTRVGDSGRPVVILQHANLPTERDEWWTAEQRAAYHDAIKGYNVVAIVDGHEAGGLGKWQGIDILGCNDITSGYWVVQIDGTELRAGRTVDGRSWRKTLKKTISLGKPKVEPKPES